MADKEINKRFKLFRESLGKKQGEFANDLNVNQQSVSDIERGIKNISLEIIENLLNKFNIDLNWLISGDGEMFLKTDDMINISNSNNTISLKHISGSKNKSYVNSFNNNPDENILKESEVNYSSTELEILKKEIEHLKKQLAMKDEIIQLLKEMRK